MTYELTLNINEDSIAGRNIETLAANGRLSREAAALQLIEEMPGKGAASPSARRILGAFREDAALVDEALEIALEERGRRNSST